MAKQKPEAVIEEPCFRWVSMDQVKEAEQKWLWEGRVPYGALTVLDGAKGVGKSTFAAALVAQVTGGKRRFDPKRRKPQRVIYLCKEESLASAILPRLIAAGADPTRCVFPGTDLSPQFFDGLSFPASLTILEEAISQEDIALFILDPLSSFVSAGCDLNNEQQARQVMEGLHAVAMRTGAAGLLIRHPRKSQVGPALNQGLGSAGINAVARSVLRIDIHPKDKDKRCLSVVATNAGAKGKTVIFSLLKAKGGVAMKIEEETDDDADDLAQGQSDPGEKSMAEVAIEFLKDKLKDGPVDSETLKKEAEQAMIPQKKLWTAKERLNILCKPVTDQNGKRWKWFPPNGGWPKGV